MTGAGALARKRRDERPACLLPVPDATAGAAVADPSRCAAVVTGTGLPEHVRITGS